MIWLEDQKILKVKHITGKNKSIYSNVFKNDYKKIIDNYVDGKRKEKDILDKLRLIKGLKFMKKIRIFIKIVQILKIK